MTQQTMIVEKSPIQQRTRMGMLCLIATEAIFFGMLIIAFLYFRTAGYVGPNPKDSLNIGLTALFSILLFSSSGTIYMADRSLARRDQRGLVIWLIATVVLGAAFLIGQLTEYISLYNDDVTVSRNTFGTTFFTLTGFHGLHVFIGLIALSLLAIYNARGKLTEGKATAVEAISLYWHFVDVVWIFVFSIVYLLALL